jgi:hypothetical protein
MAHFVDAEAEHSGSDSDAESSMQVENVNPNAMVTPRAGDGEGEASQHFPFSQPSPSIASRQASATPSDINAGAKRPRGRPRGSGTKGKPPTGLKRPVGRPRKNETTPIPGADRVNIEDHPGAHYLRSPYEARYDAELGRYKMYERTLNGLVEIPEAFGNVGPIRPNDEGILEFDLDDMARMGAATKAHPAPCTHTPPLARARLQHS